MTEFSIIKALEMLIIDPFPTKKYRAIVKLLKNVKMIMEELSEVRVCCIDEILEKLTIAPPEGVRNPRTNFVPTVEVYKMLSRLEVPSKINSLLIKLLRYLILKLSKCTSEDAHSILHDFRELKECIFVFRDNSFCSNAKLDEIIAMFVQKLIKMMKDLNADNCDVKFHLFSVIRIMIVEFGKHPVYGVIIVKQLKEEIKLYYEQMDSLDPAVDIDAYVFEYYFAYLYILNETVSRHFLNNVRETNGRLVSDLRDVLSNATSRKQLCRRETYLIQNILRMIDVYSTV